MSVALSILLQKEIWVVSIFRYYKKLLLCTYLYMPFVAHMNVLLLSIYLEVELLGHIECDIRLFRIFTNTWYYQSF